MGLKKSKKYKWPHLNTLFPMCMLFFFRHFLTEDNIKIDKK